MMFTKHHLTVIAFLGCAFLGCSERLAVEGGLIRRQSQILASLPVRVEVQVELQGGSALQGELYIEKDGSIFGRLEGEVMKKPFKVWLLTVSNDIRLGLAYGGAIGIHAPLPSNWKELVIGNICRAGVLCGVFLNVSPEGKAVDVLRIVEALEDDAEGAKFTLAGGPYVTGLEAVIDSDKNLRAVTISIVRGDLGTGGMLAAPLRERNEYFTAYNKVRADSIRDGVMRLFEGVERNR